MHLPVVGAGMLAARSMQGAAHDQRRYARLGARHAPDSIGDHLQRINGHLLSIENRLTAVEQGVTDLQVAVTSLKDRVDALPTALQVFGISCGLLVGLPVLAILGALVARATGVIA